MYIFLIWGSSSTAMEVGAVIPNAPKAWPDYIVPAIWTHVPNVLPRNRLLLLRFAFSYLRGNLQSLESRYDPINRNEMLL